MDGSCETKRTYQFLGDLGVLDLRGLVERHAADELCEVARRGAVAELATVVNEQRRPRRESWVQGTREIEICRPSAPFRKLPGPSDPVAPYPVHATPPYRKRNEILTSQSRIQTS